MRQRKGYGRYTQRSLGLSRGGMDPRSRRDAQAAAVDALRGQPPLEVNRFGQTAISTQQELVTVRGRLGVDMGRVATGIPKTNRLRIQNGALDIRPAKSVSGLASGATLSQTVGKVNELLVSLRKGGLVSKKEQ